MGAGNSDIGGTRGRRVQVRAARGSAKAEPKRNSFTAERRQAFLDHFAATCNARASAAVAGVCNSTIFAWRQKDAPFRAAWDAALEQGYARLEAELVRQACEGPAPDGSDGPDIRISGMDAKVALATLEAYRRNRGARPGDILPRASDIEAVRARLEEKMRRLRMVDAEGRLIAAAIGENPSTASRSPSPGNPGEDENPSTASRSPSPAKAGEDEGGSR